MLTLYDYLPSQNGYKIRLLLSHLDQAYRTEIVSIFEGERSRPEFRLINPTGAVPAIRLDDGRVLAESNAILQYLAEDTPYLPEDAFARAKVAQWLSFEQYHVEPTIGSLRYWTLTGRLAGHPPELVEMKRVASMKALRILDDELALRPFIAGNAYSIADMSVYAYSHLAGDADLPIWDLANFAAWMERVRSQPGFMGTVYPYTIDPHSAAS